MTQELLTAIREHAEACAHDVTSATTREDHIRKSARTAEAYAILAQAQLLSHKPASAPVESPALSLVHPI